MPSSRLSRRGLLGAALLPAFGPTGVLRAAETPAAPPSPAPASFDLARGLRLHLIQTGWVAVKQTHRHLRGPAALRFPAIMADRRWTGWLPIVAWVIEHPEGMIVVDTGETARMLTPDHAAACSAGDAWFYGRNLRFALTLEDEIGPQMRRFGLDPGAVDRVVMTHLHSDHMGGMGWFPGARFHISARDIDGHLGALTCHLPPRSRRVPVAMDGPGIGAFAASRRLTRDGAVRIVPTPGHAPGHQSVRIEADGRAVLLAGDAAFTLDQIERGQMAGIVTNPSAARATLATLRAETAAGTVILPSHDPANHRRLTGALSG